MFSVTKTELNIFPLCTRNVWPTKSGVTIELLDQVLTAAHRVVNRVHHHSAHVRTTSLPARASRFSAGDVHVIDISNLADRGETVFVNPAHFARRHLDQRVTAFEVVQDGLLTRASRNLSAA